MAGIIRTEIPRPPRSLVEAYGAIPTTIVSDMLNRMNAMHASIKPVRQGTHVVGPAVTVKCMVGDNIMTHHAIYIAKEGDVLVIDGRGHSDTSIWGGVQTIAALEQGLPGVVIDGAIRDVQDSRDSSFAVFCRGVTPAGPHKGWGGNINEPIQCGGVAVSPGDLIVGDDDGIVVIPLAEAEQLLERCQERMAEEQSWIERIRAGESTVEILGFDEKLKRMGVEYL